MRLCWTLPYVIVYMFLELWSQEEIRKKTGYVVIRADGVFDVDANTSVEDLMEALEIVIPEVGYCGVCYFDVICFFSSWDHNPCKCLAGFESLRDCIRFRMWSFWLHSSHGRKYQDYASEGRRWRWETRWRASGWASGRPSGEGEREIPKIPPGGTLLFHFQHQHTSRLLNTLILTI